MDLVTATLVGSALGVATGLLPGLHVNTLAAVALVVLAPSPAGAVLLLAVGTVHTVVNILPATYLGLPSEDDALAVLPAHRLLLQGDGPMAVRLSVAASLGALVLTVLLAPGYRWLLVHGALEALDRLRVPLLGAILALLLAQELRRGRGRALAAASIMLLAGGLGFLSRSVDMVPLVPVAGSALLPLLGGLFGAAGLTFALAPGPPLPLQRRRAARRSILPMVAGTVAASATAVLPGVTASVAAAVVPGLRADPRRAVAALSAINTAHSLFALVVWMSVARIRTGLADAVDRWMPVAWTGLDPDPGAATVLLVVLASGLLGGAATLGLDRLVGPVVHHVPSHALAMAGLAVVVGLTLLLTGWPGLLLLAAATCIGRLPVRFGVRRVHLVACLILPLLVP